MHKTLIAFKKTAVLSYNVALHCHGKPYGVKAAQNVIMKEIYYHGTQDDFQLLIIIFLIMVF